MISALKRKLIKLIVLPIFLVLHVTVVSGQQAALDTLSKNFNRYRSNYATEKIYAHLDQRLYLTGETLWFKLYLVDGSTHRPAGISKVAYVEIIDRNNHPVVQSKVAVKDGYGSGSLFLPALIEGGNYTFRAYTSWMKNFNADFYFHTNLSIINPFKKLELDKSGAYKINAQFFPEGGNLVVGLRSKVAYQVTNSQGVGIAFRGVVVDQQNDTVATFQPSRSGMGSFYVTPLQGNEYNIVVEDEQKRRSTFKLPAVLENGYAIHVHDSTANEIAVKISSRLNQIPATPVVYVFVHSRNIVANASMHFLKDGQATVLVAGKNLQEGVSHITVFDSEMRPVCERLYFKPVRRRLAVDIVPSQREFGIRRKVSLDLNVKDLQGSPQESNVSVAVYKVDSLTKRADDNILNYFWLSSDLHGDVETPEYYFSENDPDVRKEVDNLMLTRGWRRFVWNDVLSKRPLRIAFEPEYRGHIIRGKVTRPTGPSNGVLTYLSAPGRNIQVYGSLSSGQGDVKFEMKDFSGPRKIIAQTNTTKDSISTIQILSPFSNQYAGVNIPAFTLSQTKEPLLISRSIGMQVQDVYYQDREKIKYSGVDTTAFYGKADASYYLDDYTRFPVMEEILREYVPGVMVRKRRDGFHFILLDHVNKGVFDEDPLILLDGIPVFDVDKIMAFDPLKVRKLEVLNRRYYMGVLSLPGVVSYTTYGGDLAGFQLDPRVVQIDYDGLHLQREFYSPSYESSRQRDSRLPDKRQLLFWAPAVITDKEGKHHLEFFTSDNAGDYEVVVEGMTKNGVSGTGTTSFVVRPFEN
jgi:hypothetical protein